MGFAPRLKETQRKKFVLLRNPLSRQRLRYHIKNEKNGSVSVKNCIFYSSLFGPQYNSNNFIAELYMNAFKNRFNLTENIQLPFLYIKNDKNKDYLSLLNIIEHELLQKESGYLEIVKSCLHFLLLKIFREYPKQYNTYPLPYKNIEQLEDALAYINKSYNLPLTLNEVADRFHYSAPYFNKIFKIYTGTTFKKHLQNLRCQKAIILLQDSNLSIYDICNLVGYSDSKQFFMLFKKYVGDRQAFIVKKS